MILGSLSIQRWAQVSGDYVASIDQADTWMPCSGSLSVLPVPEAQPHTTANLPSPDTKCPLG
jgi:hypothetical protein